ncbi:MAG: Hsp33 family molecular chaperone HslO [Acidiferrobacterales bacterium]
MSQQDTLHRFLFDGGFVRGELARLDATWLTVLEKRSYPKPVRNVLGELMAASALLASTLKFQGSLIMQIRGNGPITLLVVECNSNGTLRATAKWRDELNGESPKELFGNSQLVITIDPKQGKERYQGIVNLQGDSISEALENYMLQSEQLDTRLWLASDNKQACGMLLQKLPQDHTIEDGDEWNRALHLADTLTREELLELDPSEIIRRLYHAETIRMLPSGILSFHCSCSRDRIVKALRMMGPDDLSSLIEEQGIVSVNCEFCSEHYEFDAVDVEQIFAASSQVSAPSARQ